MPEALALMNSLLGLSAGAGLSPRRARYFSLLRQRKVPKRKATPSLRPLRCAKGQTCGVSVAGCAAELTARLRRSVQTTAASQFTRHGRSDAHAHPATAPPQAQPAGVDNRTSKQPNSRTSIRAIAALGLVLRAQAPRAAQAGPSAAMARVDVLSPLPLWMRRGAQGLADQGSRLSERSEFERDPAKPEHRRLPRSEAQGTQTVGSPFLWFLSFGDAKERDSHAGRLPASALNEGMRPNQHPQEKTTKSIATSAYPTSASSQKHPKTTRRAHP